MHDYDPLCLVSFHDWGVDGQEPMEDDGWKLIVACHTRNEDRGEQNLVKYVVYDRGTWSCLSGVHEGGSLERFVLVCDQETCSCQVV